MKRFTISFLPVLLIASGVFAQAPKYALFEHFTQASCVPCAQQNPGFQSTILEANPSTVRHIAYHTSWPGVDEMYNYVSSEIETRTSFYGVTGVPDIFLMGNLKEGNPGAFTQSDVDALVTATSPVKIKVLDVDNGSDHDVTVTVTSVGTPPSGSYTIRTAIIERNVNYSNPPGSNGETYFPNVFRKMLPSIGGETITLPAQGNSVTFNYTYTEDASEWNMDEIACLSFIQNSSTKEIINCGATFDPSSNIANPTILTQSGTSGSASTFTLDCGNIGENSSDYSYTLTSNAPSDWSADFTVNGNTYTGTTTLTVDAGTSMPVTINVTPGTSAAMATYTLTIQSISFPWEDPVSKSVYVFKGITELVVNNTAMDPAVGTAINNTFVSAFAEVGNSAYAMVNSGLALRAESENSLVDVKNMYYNAGWYFPAFTDELVTQMMTFMDNGGNLFISGQDIGWDVWTAPGDLGHATPLSQEFYNNYMYSNFLDDGNTANKPLTANTNDPVFGNLGSIAINYYYGSTYFYPDQIEASGIGTPIFYYNNNTSKTAGVRADNGTFKVVYIAPGIEMLGTAANKNAIIKTAYDWFYGITGTASVNVNASQVGQNFPNPGDDFTLIPLSGLNSEMTFTLTDQLGRVVLNQPVEKGSSSIRVNTQNLPNGFYLYRIADSANEGITRKMEVAH